MANSSDNKGAPGKTLTAAAVGAVVGATAAVLLDKEKRQTIKSKIDDERGKIELKAQELKEKGRTEAISGLERAKQKLEKLESKKA